MKEEQRAVLLNGAANGVLQVVRTRAVNCFHSIPIYRFFYGRLLHGIRAVITSGLNNELADLDVRRLARRATIRPRFVDRLLRARLQIVMILLRRLRRSVRGQTLLFNCLFPIDLCQLLLAVLVTLLILRGRLSTALRLTQLVAVLRDYLCQAVRFLRLTFTRLLRSTNVSMRRRNSRNCRRRKSGPPTLPGVEDGCGFRKSDLLLVEVRKEGVLRFGLVTTHQRNEVARAILSQFRLGPVILVSLRTVRVSPLALTTVIRN